MPAGFAELNERGDRIEVHFQYNKGVVDGVKSIGGARFVKRENGGPYWLLPRDLQVAKRLRAVFGDGLELGDAIKEWGRTAVEQQRKLQTLAASDDVPVEELKLYKKLPELAVWLRAYQRADVAFLGTTSALNLNEPRLGKTAEAIGQVFEGDLEDGPQLVVAPQKALDSVWRMEIERWTNMPVMTWSGETPKADRAKFLDTWYLEWMEVHKGFWFITTADMVRREVKMLQEIDWKTFTVDEYHKTGLLRASGVNDEKKNSKFVLACRKIKSEKRYAMSGTPIGGRAIKLWSGLNFIAPEVFTSKWRWAEEWLDVETDENGYKEVGGIKKDSEEKFYAAHAPYIVRRLRTEVLPQLPPKLQVPVWCDMSGKQKRQYEQFAADLELRIEENRVKVNNTLTEFLRLKQFADAECDVRVVGEDEETGEPKLKLTPISSGKMPYLIERLAEEGIDADQPEGETQALVISQFREYIEWVSSYLSSSGIPNILLSGKSTKAESERAQRAFKAGNDSEGLRVCCMVTTMGVGLTLDNVTSCHVLDETWTPDDQEQATDRAINTTRNHQVSVLTYRSLNTIEDVIYRQNIFKAMTNEMMLDIARNMFKKGGGR